jgi:phosphodiesterase/alkaline phosphatase D-like protein
LRKGGTIGARSAPWGSAVVEAIRGNEVVAAAEVDDANHAWLRNLEPDTEYQWRVTVDGRP